MARSEKTYAKTKPFRRLAEKVDADPARRARVDEHNQVMLAELRRSVDLDPNRPGRDT